MEEKLHRRWVKIGGKKGSIFNGNFQLSLMSSYLLGEKAKNGTLQSSQRTQSIAVISLLTLRALR